MNAALRRCGLLGTVKYDVGGEVVAATRTTPESSDLQAMLGQMVANGCGAAVMEVSSHAMLQARVHGVQYDTAVFTNLSQDHLDYHKTMEDYFQAKRLLFQQSIELSGDQRPTLVINVDDRYGVRLADEFEGRAEVIGFGMGARADFRASKQNNNFDGTTFELTARGRQFLVQFPLIGDFNIYNALAALAVVSSLGVNLREAIQHLGECPQVPGRLESVAETVPFRVFVDYAHTPDALKNALQTLRDLQPQRLITVFGCGGDRDRDKRPAMGKTADELSDFCVVTSDNPRSENPTDILERIKVGMPSGRYVLIEDRREAIRTAINSAKDGDIVLVAGKGHEPYQEVANETIDFDDRQVARNFTRDWRPPADPS